MKAMPFIKLLFLKSLWETTWELIYVWYIKKYIKYYTHIDYLPLFNFSEIMKGKFEFLFVGRKRKSPRIFFEKVFENMNYQFKTLDNSHRRDLANLADYDYLRTIAKDNKTYSRWNNEYIVLETKIKEKKRTPFDLNDFTDYIEHTFKFAPGSIDAHKISTAKAFNNHQKAIEQNKKTAIKYNRKRK